MRLPTLSILLAGMLSPLAASRGGEVYLNTLDSRDSVVIERDQGPYVGVWAGAATGGDASLSGTLDGAGFNGKTGFAGGIKLGYYYRLPIGLRPALELELAYLNGGFDIDGSVKSGGEQGKVTGSGDFQAVMGAVNFILALDLGAQRERAGDFLAALHPYIGVGAGAAYSSIDSFEVRVQTRDGKKRVKADGGSAFDFAYQFLAGLEIELDEDFSIFGEWKRVSINDTGSEAIQDYQRNLWTIGAKFDY